jgi:hypothetical protein
VDRFLPVLSVKGASLHYGLRSTAAAGWAWCQGRSFSVGSGIARRALLTWQKTYQACSFRRHLSHAWRLLCRDTWCGLARQGVHGSQELVCDASCFSQPTQQSTMDCGWVVPDCMLSSEEESWDWLFQEGKNGVANKPLFLCLKCQIPVLLPQLLVHHSTCLLVSIFLELIDRNRKGTRKPSSASLLEGCVRLPSASVLTHPDLM